MGSGHLICCNKSTKTPIAINIIPETNIKRVIIAPKAIIEDVKFFNNEHRNSQLKIIQSHL